MKHCHKIEIKAIQQLLKTQFLSLNILTKTLTFLLTRMEFIKHRSEVLMKSVQMIFKKPNERSTHFYPNSEWKCKVQYDFLKTPLLSYCFKEPYPSSESEKVGKALKDVYDMVRHKINSAQLAEFREKMDLITESISKTNYMLLNSVNLYHDAELRHLFVKHKLSVLKHKHDAAKS